MKNRRLSLPRLGLTIMVLALFGFGVFWGWQKFQSALANDGLVPWFAPYVDVTATPQFAFEQVDKAGTPKNAVLAFIVSSKSDPCKPSWGAAYSLAGAREKLDLDRRIARFLQQGGKVTISFGGLLNNELAIKCEDETKLKGAYLEVINRYQIDTVDFDLEGEGLKNRDSLERRFAVIAEIQNELRTENRKLAVWLTLPVATFGLSEDGTWAVSKALDSGLDLAGVNAMTMDFGDSKAKNQTMSEASQQALNETHRQLGVLFEKAGISLSSESIWAKLGATVMIGQNDIQGEVFSLDDAREFNKFVHTAGLARLSMWSLNRDIACGENYVNTGVVSDSCSGVKQDKLGFASVLGEGFAGDSSANAARVTASDPKAKPQPDDPKNSPYQIWAEDGVYLEGTKVVWHRNVYQAKWWTKGDLPDNPVLQSWQTPWQMIGPVLPGEKPVPQVTLPVGTYPEWAGKEIYDAGQIVLFGKVPYRAKWWTQGDSPAASTANPDSSPWIILTQEQVDAILKAE